jgi:hypothetical protein
MYVLDRYVPIFILENKKVYFSSLDNFFPL